MIGLVGAHRTGKTSLARAYAEKHGLRFIETPISAIFVELGIKPTDVFDYSARLTIQEEILRRFDKLYAEAGCASLAIADRTPLDLLGYTMAEAIGNSVPEQEQQRFAKYAQDCIDLTNKRFSTLLVVQPGIPIVAAEGKAAPNPAYIEHLNSLMLGLSIDERIRVPHFYLPRAMLDMTERISALDFAFGRAKKRAETEREGAVIH